MPKQSLVSFFLALFLVLLIDQAIKWWFVQSNFEYQGSVISLVLVYNQGVAFSLFDFLKEWLKYLQILLLIGIFIYLWKHKEIFKTYSLPIGIIFGGGISNILDRFLHIGVVDYIYWHYKFEFAIFNFADMMINLGVFLIILQTLFKKK
ncbi:signal peptidase II [Helicobacter canadensis]|uniref:Lipoprotein signal peptidase n=1 Tax=Helicobacter canadensis MIT 98-5491 TaxID=537970 RepID=C5ZYZ1_9HELI|nr:signal peptidase II [Helicobacter canadensis]EES89249.1 signal peptidase II [Helicobacter canadensis MIT 98-5491]EFR48035.1 signal peptidase II [Helicobacter canadensis MIT 98-5491]STO99284.1 lipoprotein signal peptidase [Helicobacter canadensis]